MSLIKCWRSLCCLLAFSRLLAGSPFQWSNEGDYASGIIYECDPMAAHVTSFCTPSSHPICTLTSTSAISSLLPDPDAGSPAAPLDGPAPPLTDRPERLRPSPVRLTVSSISRPLPCLAASPPAGECRSQCQQPCCAELFPLVRDLERSGSGSCYHGFDSTQVQHNGSQAAGREGRKKLLFS
jgi:hypothetical protein